MTYEKHAVPPEDLIGKSDEELLEIAMAKAERNFFLCWMLKLKRRPWSETRKEKEGEIEEKAADIFADLTEARNAAEEAATRKVFADILVDLESKQVYLDGVRFPYHLFAEPVLNWIPEQGLGIATLKVAYHRGTVQHGDARPEPLIDPVLGDVGAYAREQMRKGYAEAFPWLKAAQ